MQRCRKVVGINKSQSRLKYENFTISTYLTSTLDTKKNYLTNYENNTKLLCFLHICTL